MKSIFFIAAVLVFFIFSCNIHKNNKLLDDKGDLLQKALLDTTSVYVAAPNFNFDTVSEGQKVVHNFEFKNTGTRALIIVSATASCGCTIAEKPEQPILPNDTGYIKVIFNSTGKNGHNKKIITVISNAHPSFPPLNLVGEVK